MIRIDQKLCQACGICGDVCPRHILVTDKSVTEKTWVTSERQDLCMECGHCAAVCPNGAISASFIGDNQLASMKANGIDDAQFLTMLSQRRSVRRYKKEKVPREIINKVIEAVHKAPTGSGRNTTGLIIIDDPEKLAELSEHVYSLYEGLGKKLKNPIARFFIKKSVGDRKLKMLRDFVMPGMRWYIRWYRQGQGNEVIRDCPVLVLFYSPVNEPVGAENCLIAVFHAILMAQVLKVGTCFNDLVPPACNRVKTLRAMLGLPDNCEVYAGITMGFPKYNFKKVPPRRLAEVRYLK
jgi:ferredoxin